MPHALQVTTLALALAGPGAALAAGQEAPRSAAPAVATVADDKLLAVLDKHKDEWRPCQKAAEKLVKNAVDRSIAAREQRLDDLRKGEKEAEDLKKEIGTLKCSEIKTRMLAGLKETGAGDADIQKAWGAFVASMKEAKAPAKPEAK